MIRNLGATDKTRKTSDVEMVAAASTWEGEDEEVNTSLFEANRLVNITVIGQQNMSVKFYFA